MRRATLYLFVSLFAVAGCKKDAAKQPNPATAQQKTVRVETAKAVKHTFSGRLPITGELKPAQEVVLKSKVGGTVVVLNFDEGDLVKKGDLIAKIDSGNQQAQLRSNAAAVAIAEAQLQRSRADFERVSRDLERVEKLAASGAADQKTLDDTKSAMKLANVSVSAANAQLDQARAVRDLAKNAVGETKYIAPITGVISRRGVSLHEYVDTMKNREIVTIVDNTAMELVAQLAADLASGITKGARVEFQVNGPDAKPIEGEVTAVSPTVDPRTRSIRLRVRIPNVDGKLKGGMYATGNVIAGGERQGIGVPVTSVREESFSPPADLDGDGEDDKQSVLWRIVGESVEKVVVRTGVTDGDLTEVVGGIQPDDQVVISSPAGLKPGVKVVVQHSTAVNQHKNP
ncbi:MAG TPA: efflux RND transporter periplasmic adaptor subunit [Pseudomonadota bacterium]|nr:efflux RND transporter periplasmic adaptor subunit [Pseudomonadota bacterium]